MQRRITKIISAIMAIAVLFAFSGCGSSITGDWHVTAVQKGDKSYDMEQLAESLGSNAGDKVSITLRIKDDGSFVLMEASDVSAGDSSSEAASSSECSSSAVSASKDSSETVLAEGKYKKKDDSYLFRIKGQDVVKGTVNDGKLVLETETGSEKDSEVISQQLCC